MVRWVQSNALGLLAVVLVGFLSAVRCPYIVMSRASLNVGRSESPISPQISSEIGSVANMREYIGATALRCPRICPVYPSVALTMTSASKEPYL